MRSGITVALGVLTGILALGSWTIAADRGGSPNDFDAAVAPILIRRCLDCHSGADAKGKFDLSRRASAFAGGESGEAIVAGKPDDSLLWEKVEAGEMPPKSPLSDAEKAAIKGWIAGGAAWGTDPIDPHRLTTNRRAGRDWWSLQPVRRTEPSPSSREGWSRSPVDRFVIAQAGSRGTEAGPRGRPPDPDPPAELRPHGAAADARGGRRLPGRPLGGRL